MVNRRGDPTRLIEQKNKPAYHPEKFPVYAKTGRPDRQDE